MDASCILYPSWLIKVGSLPLTLVSIYEIILVFHLRIVHMKPGLCSVARS